MTIFSVRGTAVRVSPFFLACALLWVLSGQASVFICALCVLFLHEAAHIAVASLLEHPVESVTLYPFGGAAIIPDLADNTAHALLIAASGPLASLLAGVLWQKGQTAGWLPTWDVFVEESYAVALFNLLPICPLDGGQVVSSLFAAALGTARGGKIMTWSSIAASTAFLVCSLACLVWRGEASTLTAAVFLSVSAWSEARRPHLPFARQKVWRHAGRVRWRKVYLDEPLLALTRTFGGACFYTLLIVDRADRVLAVATEKDVLDALFADPAARAGTLVKQPRGKVWHCGVE